MAVLSLYLYRDYRKYLLAVLESRSDGARGLQARWAEATGCQPAYMSHVLKGRAELSLEQGEALANYLNLAAGEKEYFLNLIQFARAGTPSLRAYFKTKLDEQKKNAENLKQRVRIDSKMQLEDQIQYYSTWIHGAVHMAAMIPNLSGSAQKIADRLAVRVNQVEQSLDMLVKLGLLKKTPQAWQATNVALHLENDSLLLKTLHTQWRLKSLEALAHSDSQRDLRYSGCMSISKDDYEAIKETVAQALEKAVARARSSGDETLAVLNLDFFEL